MLVVFSQIASTTPLKGLALFYLVGTTKLEQIVILKNNNRCKEVA
jgi:hypothetical protein